MQVGRQISVLPPRSIASGRARKLVPSFMAMRLTENRSFVGVGPARLGHDERLAALVRDPASAADPASAQTAAVLGPGRVCFDRNSLTRAFADVRAAPVFHSAMNSQFGSSFESSSEIG